MKSNRTIRDFCSQSEGGEKKRDRASEKNWSCSFYKTHVVLMKKGFFFFYGAVARDCALRSPGSKRFGALKQEQPAGSSCVCVRVCVRRMAGGERLGREKK